MDQTIRERAEALLELSSMATEGPWIPYENHIADSGWECVVEDVRPNNQDFIVASRTEGPCLAQKLIEALDVLERISNQSGPVCWQLAQEFLAQVGEQR